MVTVFLYTFFVGFGLTAATAVLGMINIGGDAAHGHFGHGGNGHAHAGHGQTGPPHGSHGAHGDANDGLTPINFQTIVAFLMGFGGVGYVATQLGWPGTVVILFIAAAGGITASWLIYKWFRLLLKGERPLSPTSYVGQVGRLTLGIREGGTGEIVYAHHGTRTVLAARSLEGKPIVKGEEVVVLRYEKGIAYVQPFHGLIRQDEDEGGSQ